MLFWLDFDGTIMYQDTGHVLFDNHGCGQDRREVLDEQIKSGERSFKEVSEEMWGSLRVMTHTFTCAFTSKANRECRSHLKMDLKSWKQLLR